MAERSLKYFLRDPGAVEEIIEVPGIKSIVDENGEPVPLLVKKLSVETIDKIRSSFTKKKWALDKKNNPIIMRSGEVAHEVERDDSRYTRRLIVEALVYPDLKDEKVQKHYQCYNIDDILYKVFPNMREYAEVADKVLKVLGIRDDDEPDEEELIEEVKNK